MTKSIRPSGAQEQFEYDALGNRIRFVNAENKNMRFGFDAQGRVTAITNALGNVTRYQYDAKGNLTNRIDAMNRETAYSFDEMNRLIRVDSSNSWAEFSYDANGNIVTQASPLASTSFSYDEMNRLTNSSISVNLRQFVIQNSFDLSGNRTNITYPGGLVVSYEYDEENRLSDVSISAPSAPLREFSFSYDDALRLTNIVYPNSVVSTFGYDAENRVTSFSHNNGSSNFVQRSIVRDARGFKTSENIFQGLDPAMSEGEQRREHNVADQLTHIDQRDQWTGGELNQWYNRDYTYDDNGCLTNEAVTRSEWNTNSAIQEYTVDYEYDFDNRLTLVSGGSSSTSTEYLYDASGVRIARIAGVSPAVTNYFVVDYADALKRPLCEADASGNATRFYVWAGMRLLAHIETNGTVRYYHADEQGSTLALTDETGAVTDQFAYTPYGGVNQTGTTDTWCQWLGGYGVYYDADTDLHLTLHRAYKADMHRWLSTDPLGINAFPNLYAYGDLNPSAFVDPYGLDTYRQNRVLGFLDSSGRAASRYQVLTHTFIYTTNPDGSLEHTYSWGNEYDEQGHGLWRMDREVDINAATHAIINQDLRGEKIGDSSFDPYVDEAFRALRDDPNSPSLHPNRWICDNCKTEATRLADEAQRRQQENKIQK